MKNKKSNEKILDKTEIKFLKLLLKESYISYAGNKMGLSDKQSYKISKNIKTKLNAKNMPNAVYIAVSQGLLQ